MPNAVPSRPLSIQRQLLTTLLVGLPLLWLSLTSIVAWRLWHEISELNDTQITQLTRYLIGISQASRNDPARFGDTPEIFHLAGGEFVGDLGGDLGDSEDDYLGFAIWSSTGQLMLADDNGQHFRFFPNQQGFVAADHGKQLRQVLNPFGHQWRLFYAKDTRTGRVIAVGQNYKSRQEVLYKSLTVQLIPALVGLVLFLVLVVVAVKRGFVPLNQVSRTLANRDPLDDKPLDVPVPSEIQPLVQALNALFIKVADTLAREQRFTADASHELRSPLTALKLQADVLSQQILQTGLSDAQEMALYQHSQKIQHGIERTEHLVEQLLTLAKLAPEQGLNPANIAPIDWLTLSDNVLSHVNRQAREKHSQLKRDIIPTTPEQILPLIGNATLLELLLRNLLDNAIRYTPAGSTIHLQLAQQAICVIDNGHGVTEADLARLTERFYRPAGQSVPGSGLGLSIVQRIAELHGLTLQVANVLDQGAIAGFAVTITYQKSLADRPQ